MNKEVVQTVGIVLSCVLIAIVFWMIAAGTDFKDWLEVIKTLAMIAMAALGKDSHA
jgi:heme/copper-type cytochrome/quinol oxidase subunit 4